jgi:hypothetical protein
VTSLAAALPILHWLCEHTIDGRANEFDYRLAGMSGAAVIVHHRPGEAGPTIDVAESAIATLYARGLIAPKGPIFRHMSPEKGAKIEVTQRGRAVCREHEVST